MREIGMLLNVTLVTVPYGERLTMMQIEEPHNKPVGGGTGNKGWLYVAQVKCHVGDFFAALILLIGVKFFDESVAGAK